MFAPNNALLLYRDWEKRAPAVARDQTHINGHTCMQQVISYKACFLIYVLYSFGGLRFCGVYHEGIPKLHAVIVNFEMPPD
jgi:hypothetical protein